MHCEKQRESERKRARTVLNDENTQIYSNVLISATVCSIERDITSLWIAWKCTVSYPHFASFVSNKITNAVTFGFYFGRNERKKQMKITSLQWKCMHFFFFDSFSLIRFPRWEFKNQLSRHSNIFPMLAITFPLNEPSGRITALH